jgi:transposase
MDATPLHLNTHDPTIRNMLIRKYDKYGEKYVHEEFGVTGSAVRKWKRLLAQTGSLETGFAASGRRSTLSPKEIGKLESELIKNPYATNAELAAKIRNKITPRAVGKVIAKSRHQFTWKLEGVDVEESFSPEVAKRGHAFFDKVRRIPEEQRVYVDETFASPGIKRRSGHFPKGKKSWSPRNRKYKRIVIIGAITKKG